MPARKQWLLGQAIARWLVFPAMRRGFDRVALLDLHGDAGQGLPTVLYANHVSWWDGYMAVVLERQWHSQFYLMMEEAQLARYRFFQWSGCFSVNREDAREGLRSVRYAASLLRGHPERAVWIFPQGVITPNDRRPLATFSGVSHLVKAVGMVRCVPVALRFEFLLQQRPEAFMRIGPAHVMAGDSSARAINSDLSERLLHEVELLRRDIVAGDLSQYTTVLRGHPSINVWWDRVRGLARRSSPHR
ncbi:MAG: lysophospholipid acyltransferase family protein [Herpetosiphon sp.]